MNLGFFLVRFPLFSGFIALVIILLKNFAPGILVSYIWALYFFNVFLIPGIYFLALWGSIQEGPRSVLIILASDLLKMVLSLILCAIVVLKFHPEPVVFGLNFFILYIIFSTFEIYCLLHNLRLQKKEEKTSKDA